MAAISWLVSLLLLFWCLRMRRTAAASVNDAMTACCDLYDDDEHHQHLRAASPRSTNSFDVVACNDDSGDRQRSCHNDTGPSSSSSLKDAAAAADDDDPILVTAPFRSSSTADEEFVELPFRNDNEHNIDQSPAVWRSFEHDVLGVHHRVESNRGEYVGMCADDDDPRNHWAGYAYNTGPPPVKVRFPGEFEAVDTLYVAWSPLWTDFQTFYLDLFRAAQNHVASIVVLVQESTTQTEYEEWIVRLNEAGVNVSNDNPQFRFQDAVLDSNWIRDYGPVFVQNDEPRRQTSIIDMRYQPDRLNDDAVPTFMGAWWKLPVYRLPLELEGGNLLSDGAGNCLTSDLTAEKNERNGFDEDLLKETLLEYFGCQQTLILPRLKGEKTGHVDMYVHFVGRKEVILGQYSNEDDPENARILTYANALLLQFNYKVRRIPMPENSDGVYRSYTNSLVLGDAVLFPIYRDDARYEAEAMRVFELAYPDRRVIPIDTTDMIHRMGGIHCATVTANLGLSGR